MFLRKTRKDSPVSLAEVADVVKQLLGNKVPWDAEAFRSCWAVLVGIVLQHCIEVGGSFVGWWFPFSEKGDWRMCPHYWGTTLFSLSRNIFPGKGGSNWQWNLLFRRKNLDSALSVEWWTSFLSLYNYLGCQGSLLNWATCALWTSGKHTCPSGSPMGEYSKSFEVGNITVIAQQMMWFFSWMWSCWRGDQQQVLAGNWCIALPGLWLSCCSKWRSLDISGSWPLSWDIKGQ